MNILILTSYVQANSGNLSYSMMQEFIAWGHQCEILTTYTNEQVDGITNVYRNPENKFRVYKRKIRLIFKGFFKKPKVNDRYYFQDKYEVVTFIRSRSLLKKITFLPDVILVHFNMNFLNAKNFYQLNKLTGAPLLLLLMDMAPMTGGCHYAWDCIGYHRNCGKCPGLYSRDEKDLSHRIFQFRKKYFSRTDIRVIAASSWQVNQLKQSALLKGKPLHTILSAFNINLFKPGNKSIVRKIMGLPESKKIVFFGAAGVDEERKGIRLLLSALHLLKKNPVMDDLFLVLAGNANKDFLDNLPIDYKYLGYVNDVNLARAFQAADVFACSSIEDSGPTMINMAILCGTPVVSFNMGVSPDLVIDTFTGFSTPLADIQAYAKNLEKVLTLPPGDYQVMSQNCRELGLKKCNPKLQMKQYEQILSILK